VPEKIDLTDSDENQYARRSKAGENFEIPTFLNFAFWSLGKHIRKRCRDDNSVR